MLLSDKYPFLTNYFKKVLLSKNHAYPQSILFYGSDFESQYILANEIARILNCTNNPPGNDDCDCLNCKWIREKSHPAVKIISKLDNKPEDDESKTVISVKQSQLIKELLVSDSDFYRIFIFCDKDSDGNIGGLNSVNFQEEMANSLLKIIEEPQPRVMFIFITRYKDDILPTILSRSQSFFVPSKIKRDFDYKVIDGIFTDYFNFERKRVFDISQKLQELSEEFSVTVVLDNIQNYILSLLKYNPKSTFLIKHIELVEKAKRQDSLGIKSANIFDDLCLSLIQ